MNGYFNKRTIVLDKNILDQQKRALLGDRKTKRT